MTLRRMIGLASVSLLLFGAMLEAQQGGSGSVPESSRDAYSRGLVDGEKAARSVSVRPWFIGGMVGTAAMGVGLPYMLLAPLLFPGTPSSAVRIVNAEESATYQIAFEQEYQVTVKARRYRAIWIGAPIGLAVFAWGMRSP